MGPMNVHKSVALLLITSSLLAAASGYTTIPDLIKESDAVLIGTVVNGGAVGNSITFTLSVDRMLKGVNGLTTAVAEWKSPVIHQSGPLTVSDRGMWFLRATQKSVWEPLPVQSGPSFQDLYYRMPPLSAAMKAIISK